MSKLRTNDKQVLEKLFQMKSGWVLNFKDRSFAEFFRDDVNIDINDRAYAYASGSKANRLRGFWQAGSDQEVALSIKRMIKYIGGQILVGELKKDEFPEDLIAAAQEVASALAGGKQKLIGLTEDEFATQDLGQVSAEKLELDSNLRRVLTQRIAEIDICLQHGASLAAIFLCGSTLEGVLLGIARSRPVDFNQAKASPKDRVGKQKQFPDWSLSDFINVAKELRLLGEDVSKFSHALRDFRNYIHPYEQMTSGFTPDQHTATICAQVLKAAIAQLSK